MADSRSAAAPLRPFWIPPEVKFDQLPPALQHALVEIVHRVYEERVLGASTALESAQGMSYVELAFWEVLQQFELAQDWAKQLPYGGKTKGARARFNRLLRTIHQKDRIAQFLLSAEKFFEKAGEIDPLQRVSR